MSMFSKSNPRELVDRYIHAVRFWLPKSQQADIVAELSADLHAQIEEKETGLGRPLNEEEVTAILKRCGTPIVVASHYRPQSSLIGPVLFPIYQFVMKLVLLWVLGSIFLVIVGPAMILPAANRWSAFFSTLGTLWTALFMSAAVITLVFAVLERSGAALKMTEWNNHSLPPLPKNPQPSTGHSIFEVVCALGGILYLLAVPHYPFLLLGPAAAFLKINPVFVATFYWPLLLLAALGAAQRVLVLARPQWTWYPQASRFIGTLLGLIFINCVLNAASQAPNGQWHPYVVLADGVSATVQLKKTEAIVNLSILLSMAGTWIGMSIAAVIEAWKLVRHLRRSTSEASSPALLRMF